VGVRRLTRRTVRAGVGLAVSWLLVTVGAAVAWGSGYGLLAAGVSLAAYLLVIYDVDEPDTGVDTGPAVVNVHPLRTLRDLEADEDGELL
jgi:hypothetical protein